MHFENHKPLPCRCRNSPKSPLIMALITHQLWRGDWSVSSASFKLMNKFLHVLKAYPVYGWPVFLPKKSIFLKWCFSWNLSMNIYIFSVFFAKSFRHGHWDLCYVFVLLFSSLMDYSDKLGGHMLLFWFKSVLKLQEWRFGGLCLFAYMNPHWGFPNASNLLFD